MPKQLTQIPLLQRVGENNVKIDMVFDYEMGTDLASNIQGIALWWRRSAVLLLLGHPQTHMMWHHITPLLAMDFKPAYFKRRKLIVSDSLEKNQKAWIYAINLNQLDGAYQPNALLTAMMKEEIQGNITTEEIVNKLQKTYKNPK